jgi:hypothetical protein
VTKQAPIFPLNLVYASAACTAQVSCLVSTRDGCPLTRTRPETGRDARHGDRIAVSRLVARAIEQLGLHQEALGSSDAGIGSLTCLLV